LQKEGESCSNYIIDTKMSGFPLIARLFCKASRQAHRVDKSSNGFTLVEVAMALGIFSFAIIPVIGLMGTAQNVSQESIRASAKARIFEQVTPLLSSTSALSALLVSGTSYYYFTGAGQLTTVGGTGNTVPVFTAAASVSGSFNDVTAGLSSNKVIQVKIQHYMGLGALTNTTGTLGTTFIVFSQDPGN